ncbi:MAG: hypothetical protein WCX64_04700 [Candidatus Micrarchaeia archaeon]
MAKGTRTLASAADGGKNADGSRFLWLSVPFWLGLLVALAYSPAMPLFHSAVGILTEGNSTAKAVLFVAFLAICLTARGLADRVPLVNRIPKRVLDVFLALAVVSMAYGLLLHAAFFSSYAGADANSFVSHVTQCGGSWCWEGTYLQHNHVAKTAVYFVEKTFGLSVGPQSDNGEPLYSVFPQADLFALVTLAISGLLLVFGVLSALKQDDALDCLLVSCATALFFIASVDGGLFSQTGINACVFASVFLLRRQRQVHAELRFLIPVAVGALIAVLPNLLFGTYLIFRDWFYGAVAVSALFAFVDAESGWKKMAFLSVLVFSLLFFSVHAIEKVEGPLTSIPRATELSPGLPPSPNLVIYGLPADTGICAVKSLLPEMNFSSAAKYGWYFVTAANSTQAITLTTEQVAERFRSAFPQGYLYASMNRNGPELRTATIHWIRKPEGISYSGLFSFRLVHAVDDRDATTLTGIASASGPMLGLEIGSYIQSLGGDAVVTTLIV